MPITYTFKKCPGCDAEWKKREDLLKDKDVRIVAYEANLDVLPLGKFFFRHACGATFAISVDGFSDLYKGPVFNERKTGTPECLGYCKLRDQLGICPTKCECAWVRQLIQVINNMKKA